MRCESARLETEEPEEPSSEGKAPRDGFTLDALCPCAPAAPIELCRCEAPIAQCRAAACVASAMSADGARRPPRG